MNVFSANKRGQQIDGKEARQQCLSSSKTNHDSHPSKQCFAFWNICWFFLFKQETKISSSQLVFFPHNIQMGFFSVNPSDLFHKVMQHLAFS